MGQVFGIVTFLTGIISTIVSICILFNVMDEAERDHLPKLFLTAIALIGFGWSFMRDEPVG